MSYSQHTCPNCGAPLPPPPPTGSVRCGYCSVLLASTPGGWRPAAPPAEVEPLRDPHLPRLWIGGARYAVLGRLARGEGSDALLGRRDGRLTELVVIKALRACGDADLLAREDDVLESLEKSQAQGAPHFSRLLPQRVAHGLARLGMTGEGGERRVSVHRFRSGFVHTWDNIAAAHPSGVAPEAAVWLWKRTLELLGFLHESGWVHGAVLPPHLLVHARDHGVVLVGFSRAVPPGRPLPAFSRQLRAHYPDAVWNGGPATAATDVAMSARAVLRVLGGAPGRAPSSLPAPLAELLLGHATGDRDAEAWVVRDALDEVARRVFGPPKFIPLPMPGWG